MYLWEVKKKKKKSDGLRWFLLSERSTNVQGRTKLYISISTALVHLLAHINAALHTWSAASHHHSQCQWDPVVLGGAVMIMLVRASQHSQCLRRLRRSSGGRYAQDVSPLPNVLLLQPRMPGTALESCQAWPQGRMHGGRSWNAQALGGHQERTTSTALGEFGWAAFYVVPLERYPFGMSAFIQWTNVNNGNVTTYKWWTIVRDCKQTSIISLIYMEYKLEIYSYNKIMYR